MILSEDVEFLSPEQAQSAKEAERHVAAHAQLFVKGEAVAVEEDKEHGSRKYVLTPCHGGMYG